MFRREGNNNPKESPGLTNGDILAKFNNDIEQYCTQSTDRSHCCVRAEKNGTWFVLVGKVDCQRTRAHLLSMVPKKNGVQWVVDHMVVGERRTRPRTH